MSTFTLFAVTGIAAGALYALVAVGFVLVYNASGVLNFAHGAFIAVGAFVTWWLAVRSDWLDLLGERSVARFVIAVMLAGAATAFAATLVDRRLLRRLATAPVFSLALVTLGLNIVIGAFMESRVPPGANAIGSPLQGLSTSIGGTNVADADLWTIGVAVVVLGILAGFFRWTTVGLGIRSIAMDREAAEVVGLPVAKLVTAMWAMAGAMAVVAGALQLSKPGQGLDAETSSFALRAFPAAIVGGLSSVSGAVVGGLLIGLVEAYVQFFQPDLFGHNFHLVAPYAVMVLVLLLRPEGLFGSPAVQRA